MPIHTDNTSPAKRRVKEKKNVNTNEDFGNVYRAMYLNQGRVCPFSGLVMEEDDTILVNADNTHVASESGLDAFYGGVPLTYTAVDVSEVQTTDTYVEDIDHYEAWT